jgi:hypothetical protein
MRQCKQSSRGAVGVARNSPGTGNSTSAKQLKNRSGCKQSKQKTFFKPQHFAKIGQSQKFLHNGINNIILPILI